MLPTTHQDPVPQADRATIVWRREPIDRTGSSQRVRQERVDVRVAAEHPVQAHDVGAGERQTGAVANREVHPFGEPALVGE